MKKVLFFLILFFVLISFSSPRIQSNEEFLKSLLEESDPFSKKTTIYQKVFSFFSKMDFKNPVSFLESFFHQEKKIPSSDEEEFYNPMSVYIKDPKPMVVDSPLIYIYNTHQLESYSIEDSITPNVMMASYLLREFFLKKGISSIVEEGDITEFLNVNHWSYQKSYEVSRYYLKEAMEKNPSLEYFIDLHRDSISKNQSTITLNGVSYAKVLFVIGTDYESYEENFSFVQRLHQKLESSYPGISRGIVLHGGKNYNGVYNQDLNSKVILLECGGQENTIEEVYHTLEAFSEVFASLIGGTL